jgi:hypothetical protein
MRTAHVISIAAGGLAFLLSTSVASAAPVWLQCIGSVSSKGKDAAGKPIDETGDSKRVLVFDDATNGLFNYSENRKALDVILPSSYSAKEIRWTGRGTDYPPVSWEGVLSRTAMTLRITREQGSLRMIWQEKCEPIQPLLTPDM